MTAKISDYKNVFYSRDYSNDISHQRNLAKRVALAAVPFLSLHSSLRFPISLAMGSLRVRNCSSQDILRTTIAIIALAGAIFQHRVGMVITTTQDIWIEIQKLQTADNKENVGEEVLKSLAKIVNNLLYLTLISVGGLELSLAAFMTQAIINIIQARDEFKQERWIEGVANLLMAGVHLQQSYTQGQHIVRKLEIEKAMKRLCVGELHEKWQFPSDHLPVGIEVNGIRIISWNVLNNVFMEWVTDKDSQGLKGSMISDLDIAVNENGLTMRDMLIANMVQKMTGQGQIIALQECGKPFLQHLEEQIPSNWNLIKSFNEGRRDQDVILYNQEQLTYQAKLSETAQSAYLSAPGRPIQNAYFSQQEKQDLRIINSHIPGDFDKPGKEEFAQYVQQQHKEGSITVALGDNNFERDEMIEAYQKAGFSDFSLHSPWKTNIDPHTKQSKGIDHFFIAGNEDSKDLKPEEVLPEGNLQETINLLNPKIRIDWRFFPIMHMTSTFSDTKF